MSREIYDMLYKTAFLPKLQEALNSIADFIDEHNYTDCVHDDVLEKISSTLSSLNDFLYTKGNAHGAETAYSTYNLHHSISFDTFEAFAWPRVFEGKYRRASYFFLYECGILEDEIESQVVYEIYNDYSVMNTIISIWTNSILSLLLACDSGYIGVSDARSSMKAMFASNWAMWLNNADKRAFTESGCDAVEHAKYIPDLRDTTEWLDTLSEVVGAMPEASIQNYIGILRGLTGCSEEYLMSLEKKLKMRRGQLA